MDTPWRIELLGRLRATQGDRVITRFRTQRTGALLAYLAYFLHRPHPREELIELLWPETEPHSGRGRLSRELTSLRRQLEPPGVPAGAVIVADHAKVQLNSAACVTDVMVFEAACQAATRATGADERIARLIDAAEQYRGALLPGHFEGWVLPERQRLQEAFLTALSRLVVRLTEAGDARAAIEWARRAVAADPLREQAHHELIRLLIAVGEPAAALSQYHELERLLAQELGTTPAPETSALLRGDTGRPHLLRASDGRSSQSRLEDGVQSTEPGPAPPRRDRENDTESAASASPTPAAAIPLTSALPLSFTRFFGREREIESLRNLLLAEPMRLVTLVGPGGTGKTRLALETARQMHPALEGRVWFVSLLDLTDSRLIADKLLESLHVPRSPQIEPLEQVARFLSADLSTRGACQAPPPSLLLLDNFEHLVEGGRDLVRTLLERVESLTVLVTSRRCLGMEGEQEFPVPPLTVPRCVADPAELIQSESVRLFVDRAQAVRPDFQVTRTNAGAVAALCVALEGLPLALELAGARIGVLTPQQMLDRLRQRFDLLASGRRGTDPRHRSLRAALDWSYQLLPPELQRFFTRLSVFRGGWTLEAAASVCAEPKALEYLEQLRECSLVLAKEISGAQDGLAACPERLNTRAPEHPNTGMRFRLLEMLREFGDEQLAPEERADVARRHLCYYLALAERAETELHGPEDAAWLDLLEAEHDNMRTALTWSLERDVEAGLRLATALEWFWQARDYCREGRDWLERVLERGRRSAPALRVRAHVGLARLSYWLGDYASVAGRACEGLALSRELGDTRLITRSLHLLGLAAMGQGQNERAASLLDEGISLARKLGDNWLIAQSLNCRGHVAYIERDYSGATILLEESVARYRQVGDKTMAVVVLTGLGNVALHRGEYGRAGSFYEEALGIAGEVGYQRGAAECLEGLARLRKAQGHAKGAVRLMGAAEGLRAAIFAPRSPLWHPDYQSDVEALRAQLGEAAFAVAWAGGRALTCQQAVVLALEEAPAG